MMTLNSNDDLKGDDMMIYNDNIIIRKIWQDPDMVELRVVCLSTIVSVKSQIYVKTIVKKERGRVGKKEMIL